VTRVTGELEQSFRLRCSESQYPILLGTYDGPEWQLRDCEAKTHYVDVLVAFTDSRVAIEVHEIGGMSESQDFRELRLASERLLREALPEAQVQVQYPYGAH
jgi:hypothetical protein